jgi:hypothetical protein
LPSVLRAGLGGGTGRNRRSQIIRLFNRLRTHNQIFQILEEAPGSLLMDKLIDAESEVLQEAGLEY